MPSKQEEISQLEKDAKQLKENIKTLYEKAGNYQSASETLTQTNDHLVKLISETEELAAESHNIIKSIKEIGSEKIFDKLDSIEKSEANLKDLIVSLSARQDKRNKINFFIMVGGIIAIIILEVVLIIK